ncbi:Spondin-1 [Gracilariopsis chorda]|uniref:Spondin-1 n=1 Tax=Gracilariopsis chorda TaxID=448386 RepID=A0A2V3IRW7_9FLOR|nr:Spondin-1 [Gracilariopsis chorda]|eukprot:PXF44854.1 Spondin-1 [Gracilariopsis chorda]
MIRKVLAVFLTLALFEAAVGSGCSGQAVYQVSFTNLLTPENFGELIPSTGLVFSPLAGASHSNRFSFFTIRGFASPQVEQIAETGQNGRFVAQATNLVPTGKVRSVASADGPTMPGTTTSLLFTVDCARPFITMLGMVAPSPDWIVQINNRNMFRDGMFISSENGTLIAYDTGTDDGREFTSPVDASLDIPTEPQKNIAPLVEDETDRFEGRIIGTFDIRKVE